MLTRVLCGLIAASPLALTQTVGSVEAASPVSALITSSSGRSFATVPRGTKRTWGGSEVGLLALAEARPNLDAVRVEAKLDRQASTGAILGSIEASADVIAHAAGITMATSNSPRLTAAPGPVEIRFVHPAPRGTKKVFTFEFLPVSNDLLTPASFLAEVDVDDNRTVDWRAPVTNRTLASRKMTVTAGNRGFVILLRLSARSTTVANSRLRSGWSARLNYAVGQWRKCETSNIGAGCGPILRGQVASVDASLTLAGRRGYSRGIGILWMGATQTNIRLAPTTCRLYTWPILAFPHTTDAFGDSPQITFPIPPSLVGDIYWQMAHSSTAVPTPQWRTTNGVRLRCTRL